MDPLYINVSIIYGFMLSFFGTTLFYYFLRLKLIIFIILFFIVSAQFLIETRHNRKIIKLHIF